MVAPFIFIDNARSTLGAPLSIGGTTITLASGGGALFPNPGPNQQFALTLNDLATQTLFETVWCIARAGDVLTVIRAMEGTTAKAWGIGDYCWNGPTAGQMNNLVQIPHMTDASIAPVFGATQVQGTFAATGAATFSSTGQFGSTVTATDPGTGSVSGVSVQGPGAQGARIALHGTGATPNKFLRSVNGSFDIVNSDYTTPVFRVSDLGDVDSIRNLSASGGGSFAGPVASNSNGSFTDTGTQGLLVNGTGGNGANLHLHTATGDKWIREINNQLQVISSGYLASILSLDNAGNLSLAGAGNFAGALGAAGNITSNATVVGGTGVQANNGNVTAFGGRLRASYGARGSGDSAAGVLLGDYYNSGNYNIFPNGLILQWGYSGVGVTQTQTEGGFTWYFLPIYIPFAIAFPSAVGAVLTTTQDYGAHLAVNTNVDNVSLNGFNATPHASNVLNIFFYWAAIGW